MPANLPPQYSKAEEEFRKALSPADRLDKLREMFPASCPSIRGRKASVGSEAENQSGEGRNRRAKSGGKKGGEPPRPREGAGQIVLVGAPNAGRSAMLTALTNAKPEVAPHPFTTGPPPGIMFYEDVRIQLVDLPPISPDFLEPWVPSLIRLGRHDPDGRPGGVTTWTDGLLETALARLGRRAYGTGGERCPTTSRTRRSSTSRRCWSPTRPTPRGLRTGSTCSRRMVRARFSIATDRGRRRRPGRSEACLVRFTGRHAGLYQKAARQTGRPNATVHHPYRRHGCWTWLGDSSRTSEQSLKCARVWGTGVFEGQTVKRVPCEPTAPMSWSCTSEGTGRIGSH